MQVHRARIALVRRPPDPVQELGPGPGLFGESQEEEQQVELAPRQVQLLVAAVGESGPTLATLDKGTKNVEILKQGQYSPMTVEKQIAIIYCGTHGLLAKIPVEKVKEFETEYLDFLELKHKDTLAKLRSGVLTNKEEDVLDNVAREIVGKYEVKE